MRNTREEVISISAISFQAHSFDTESYHCHHQRFKCYSWFAVFVTFWTVEQRTHSVCFLNGLYKYIIWHIIEGIFNNPMYSVLMLFSLYTLCVCHAKPQYERFTNSNNYRERTYCVNRSCSFIDKWEFIFCRCCWCLIGSNMILLQINNTQYYYHHGRWW